MLLLPVISLLLVVSITEVELLCKSKPERTTRCRLGSDCDVDECCVSTVPQIGRKKRSLFSRGGVCQHLQTVGQGCLTKYDSGQPNDIVSQCPCEANLECVGNGLFVVPQGETGTCQAKEVTCKSGADCGPGECCKGNDQVKGRKKRQIGGSVGVCTPLQTSGGSCLTQYGSGKPSSIVPRCPCVTSLTCQSTGVITVPLGEEGTCA
ncbi:uncharacterized protein [Haliotis cracherodii]|uniref:uncharacterized protein isoform X1 n=1 Tax=Haliotis cracherodii TaxID=6455 RepID=UPI0039E7BE5C